MVQGWSTATIVTTGRWMWTCLQKIQKTDLSPNHCPMTPKKRAPLKCPALSLSSESTGTWTWEARAKKLTETNRKNFTHAHFNQIWAPRYNTTKTHWILSGVKFCNIWTNLDAPYSCTPQKRVTMCVMFLACSEWFDLEQFKVILTCILLTDPSTEVINAGGAKTSLQM